MPRLSVRSVRKNFGSHPALTDASLEVGENEIHAVLGENGAGKTTLMNILFGLVQPDSGTIRIDGKPYSPRSPGDALRSGLGMVHQHFMLVPTLTVAENVVLGEKPFGLNRGNQLRRRLEEKMKDLPFRLPLESKAGDLSVGELQRAEIFKLLWKGADLLILDEPTAVLTPQEIDDLFILLTRLRENGKSILFISHKLGEIRRLCKRVTILRKGKTVATVDPSKVSDAELSRLMMGSERAVASVTGRSPRKTPCLSSKQREDEFLIRCQGDTGSKLRGNWECRVTPGEITGVAGVEGNGQAELGRLILGIDSSPHFEVSHRGKPVPPLVRDRIRWGLSFISEDRQKTGLILEFNIRENLALKDISAEPWSRWGWLQPRRARKEAERLIEEYSIQPPDPEFPISALSGGNQQKVVAAREISRPHRLLLALNPTRGLDVVSCEYVLESLRKEAENGSAVLFISTELDEILRLSDRIYVLFQGEITEIPVGERSRERLGLAMLGTEEEALPS